MRHLHGATTDLPVLLPIADQLARRTAAERQLGAPIPRLKAVHGIWLVAVFLIAVTAAEAQTAPGREGVISVLISWSPVLLKGFVFNIAISFMAMAIGTVAGGLLGVFQISLLPPVRRTSWVITQFFRNAPWLVLLFFAMFLLPFEFRIGNLVIPFPDWVKATIGLSLPVMANVSEIVRGGIVSIPSGQWEAAESLAFTRRKIITMIILPQCIKRMLPPWMNLYAILTMATVLASIVGVSEMMTQAQRVLAAEVGRTDLLVPIYGYVLIWFFIYCYPIARWTVWLERKFQVEG